MEAATAIAAAGAAPAALPDHETSPGLAAVGESKGAHNVSTLDGQAADVDSPTVVVERHHSFACSCGACPPGPVLRVDGPRHRTAAGKRRPAFGWLVAAGAAAVVALVLGVVFLVGRDPNAAAAQHTVATAGLPPGSPLSLTPAPSTSGVPTPTPSAARPTPARSAARTAAPNDAAPLAPVLSALVLATGSAGATLGKITGTTSVVEVTPSTSRVPDNVPAGTSGGSASPNDPDPPPNLPPDAPTTAAHAPWGQADTDAANAYCRLHLADTAVANGYPSDGEAWQAQPPDVAAQPPDVGSTGWHCAYAPATPTPGPVA